MIRADGNKRQKCSGPTAKRVKINQENKY